MSFDDSYHYNGFFDPDMIDEEIINKINRKAQRKAFFQGLNMAKKKSKHSSNKPTLLKVGKHYINPADVRSITEVRDGLYVVKFLSDPNPTYACWIEEEDIEFLLSHFNILVEN